jgi:hypothetical protein
VSKEIQAPQQAMQLCLSADAELGKDRLQLGAAGADRNAQRA